MASYEAGVCVPRPSPFAVCVVRYKNKIKSITWQTTPHLCGNLLFLDCVCSRRRQSQRSRCKVKCIIFPFGGECDPFSKGHTERALLALCLNSQLSFLPLSLPARRPCRVAIYEDLCGRCGLFWRWRMEREKPFGGVATPLAATPSQLAVLVHLF